MFTQNTYRIAKRRERLTKFIILSTSVVTILGLNHCIRRYNETYRSEEEAPLMQEHNYDGQNHSGVELLIKGAEK